MKFIFNKKVAENMEFIGSVNSTQIYCSQKIWSTVTAEKKKKKKKKKGKTREIENDAAVDNLYPNALYTSLLLSTIRYFSSIALAL